VNKDTSELEYENPWLYNGSPFTSNDIQDYFGFVYLITNKSNGKKYIGRKNLYFHRKPKGKTRKVKQSSDWMKYYGSSDELKEDIKIYGKENFKREILSLHKTQGKLNFEETRQLFLNNVLSEALDTGEPLYYNNNILGRYFRKDYFNFLVN
jgi:hypothetical protein